MNQGGNTNLPALTMLVLCNIVLGIWAIKCLYSWKIVPCAIVDHILEEKETHPPYVFNDKGEYEKRYAIHLLVKVANDDNGKLGQAFVTIFDGVTENIAKRLEYYFTGKQLACVVNEHRFKPIISVSYIHYSENGKHELDETLHVFVQQNDTVVLVFLVYCILILFDIAVIAVPISEYMDALKAKEVEKRLKEAKKEVKKNKE